MARVVLMRPLWRYYNPHSVYRIAPAPASPAFEVSLANPTHINPLPRFSAIFAPLLENGLAQEEREPLENLLLHFLALLDLSCGLDRRELYLKRFHQELENGLWGANIASSYALLSAPEQRDIQNFLYEQEIKCASCLRRLLGKWYPGILFYHVQETDEIILAIPSTGEDNDRQKLNLILDLFAPFRHVFHICWQSTPCLLDEAEAVLDTCILV